MKKIILLFFAAAFAGCVMAQTSSFTVTTTPCHNDGVLTVNFTGLTAPLTVDWYTSGTTGTTITHSGVSGLSDALTSYSGGPVNIFVTDAMGAVLYNYYPGAPPFTYSLSSTPAVCPALGTETATVSGGTSPYTYQWYNTTTSTIVGTVNPISLPGGSYGVVITDAAGCVYGSTVNNDSGGIYSIAPFSVPVSSTVASCTNGTATVGTLSGGTTPYSYLWSNGATSSSITGLLMGSYNVTVTDAMGCSAMAYVYVSQSITITVPVTPSPATCLATDGAVIAFGSGGAPPYTYLWSNGATTASQTGLASDYYDVTATDANGCIGSGGGYVSASTPITATYATTPSLCTSATGTATLTLSGGSGGYTVAWYTTPPQTGLSATALAPGNYSFHVTDGAGCVRTGTVTIPPVDIINASFSATSALCATPTGSLTVSPSGGVTPYTYLWSTGATTAGISSVPAGGYSVVITDANGCSVNKSHAVIAYSPLGVGLSTSAASCIFTNDGSITATPYGGTTPYAYLWSGGGTTSTISGLHYGPYYLTVTDAAGCSSGWLYDYVGYNPSATSCYCTISGTVYHDVNGNCIQDSGEPGIPNIQVHCSGIGYTYTDMSGHYSFKVPSGSYIITETILAFYPLSSCQANDIPVTATASSGCVIPVDFANAINPIHDIHFSTWDYNWPIPGHTYTQVSVISNEGTVTEGAVLAGYKPDGQVFAPSFVPSGIFTGAPYWYNTAAGFPSLSPGFSQYFLMNYTVPTDIPLSTNLVFKDTAAYSAPMTNWLTDYSPWNNVNYFNSVTVSSYDPNFKEVSPKGVGPTGLITYADSVLEYMVHFQNTGTAPAENVIVIDTLDNDLDWTTLRPVYQSAQGQVTLNETGTTRVAKFTFKNINLPPQSGDEIRSNGMFTYTIHTRSGLPVGTQFKNKASIYFDYNEPVVTNTTVNTLGATLASPSNTITAGNNNSFLVYPNPAGNAFNVVMNANAAMVADMNVADVTGKILISKTVDLQKGTQTIMVNAEQLASGVYFVTLNLDGSQKTQKLVIIK